MMDGPPSAIEDLDRQPFIAGAPGEARYFHDRFGSLFRGAGIAMQDVTFVNPVHTVQGGAPRATVLGRSETSDALI